MSFELLARLIYLFCANLVVTFDPLPLETKGGFGITASIARTPSHDSSQPSGPTKSVLSSGAGTIATSGKTYTSVQPAFPYE